MSRLLKGKAYPSIYGAVVKLGKKTIVMANGLNNRIPPNSTVAVFESDDGDYQVVGRKR